MEAKAPPPPPPLGGGGGGDPDKLASLKSYEPTANADSVSTSTASDDASTLLMRLMPPNAAAVGEEGTASSTTTGLLFQPGPTPVDDDVDDNVGSERQTGRTGLGIGEFFNQVSPLGIRANEVRTGDGRGHPEWDLAWVAQREV